MAEEGHEFRQNIRSWGKYLKPLKSLIQTRDDIEINRSLVQHLSSYSNLFDGEILSAVLTASNSSSYGYNTGLELAKRQSSIRQNSSFVPTALCNSNAPRTVWAETCSFTWAWVVVAHANCRSLPNYRIDETTEKLAVTQQPNAPVCNHVEYNHLILCFLFAAADQIEKTRI